MDLPNTQENKEFTHEEREDGYVYAFRSPEDDREALLELGKKICIALQGRGSEHFDWKRMIIEDQEARPGSGVFAVWIGGGYGTRPLELIAEVRNGRGVSISSRDTLKLAIDKVLANYGTSS